MSDNKLNLNGEPTMTNNELKQYIELDLIDLIRFYKDESTTDKTAWLIVPYCVHKNMHKCVPGCGHALVNSSREKSTKTFTSLDRAYAAIKAAGYKGCFEVDDGSIFDRHLAI
jgi:hypothetical protein